MLKRLRVSLLHPVLIALAFGLYAAALAWTGHVYLSAYGALVIPGLILLAVEFKYPYRRDWVPNFKELRAEMLNLFGVQTFVPLAIFALVRGGLHALGFANGVLWNIWPADIPFLAQFAIVMIVGELFQYAWHRLCHTYPLLWPVHAVHHAPQKLFSANTARFHPFDKAVEFFFDVQIFLLLGAPLELMGAYFVYFAMSGFFQHCNTEAHLGRFDVIFSGADSHRQHHHANPQEAKCNYGNNLMIWDYVFGTYKGPRTAPVSRIGLQSANAPKNFREDFSYPFKLWRSMGAKAQIEFWVVQRLLNFFLPLKMRLNQGRRHRALMQAARNPRPMQAALLEKILQTHRDTAFGKMNRFGSLKTVDDFRRQVPIASFESFRPFVDQMIRGVPRTLVSDSVNYFTKTSGTTGLSKYIPVTENLQRQHLRGQEILAYSTYLVDREAFNGRLFSVVGNEVEEVLTAGMNAGSLSGKLYALTPNLLMKKHTVPVAVSRLNDYDLKFLILGALAILAPEVSFYISPNPTTLLKLIETINSRRDDIAAMINANSAEAFYRRETDRDALKDFNFDRLRFNIPRALKLLRTSRALKLSDVWPDLRVVTGWTGGSCAYLIPKLRASCGTQTRFIELGYLSSEYRGTVTVEARGNVQCPTLMDNFYEFIERRAYENGDRETLLLDQLEEGREYYIIATTQSGLYRYFINDIVRVTEIVGRTPALTFIQKGKGVTNITGEKLTEHQLVSYFSSPASKEWRPSFFVCLADSLNHMYRLYFEAQEETIDVPKFQLEIHRYLCEANEEYKSKTESGRLRPIEIHIVNKGTGEQYKRHCLTKGQRESQFKFLHLLYAHDNEFPFDKHRSHG